MSKREKDENPKQQALVRLQSKIEEARAAVEATTGKARECGTAIQKRVTADATGGAPYSLADRRADAATLDGLNLEARRAGDNLAILENALPEVRVQAARETLGALDADLAAFDRGPLAEALGIFGVAWNAMVEAREAVEAAYQERGALVESFMTTRRELPAPENTQTWPTPSALCSSVGFRRAVEDADLGELKVGAFAAPVKKSRAPEPERPVIEDPGPERLARPVGECAAWSRQPQA